MTNSLFNAKEYYSRQTALAELGEKGQERLRRAKVVVVGLGGLGTISTLYLARAGVGYLRLVDPDTVELKNLHRQVLYNLQDLRYPKVEAAAEEIRIANPEIVIDPVPDNVRENNVADLVNGMDCIVDGLDNMQTRYIVNRASVRNKIPYVFGAAIGLEGNLSVFVTPETPCLECILPNLDDKYLPKCDVRGVLGATPGIIGSMQALETIKVLTGIGNPLKGKLMVCDFRDMYFETIEVSKRLDCPVCGLKPASKAEATIEKPALLCGGNTVNVNPPKAINVDAKGIYEKLKNHYGVLLKSSFVVVLKYSSNVEVSVFTGGRMLIKNVRDEGAALEIYNKLMEELGIQSSKK